MKRIGSQIRETLVEVELHVESIDHQVKEAVLVDNEGRRGLYAERDNFAGHVVEINGRGYEFIRSLPDKGKSIQVEDLDAAMAVYP